MITALLVGLLLPACRPSDEDRVAARSTEIAAQIYATQTAEVLAPTASPTATFTRVPTSLPTAAPTPTATPIPPTPTPTPAPTDTPRPASPEQWSSILLDNFDSNANDWPTGTETNEYATNNWRISGGKYRWEAQAHQDVHWYVYPAMRSVYNFYLSVEAQQVSGPQDSMVGLAFCIRGGNNFYLFGISDTKEYIVLRSYRGRWTPLVDWSRSSAIRRGQVNRLAVVAEDGHFDFFINDQLVTGLDDDKLGRGKAGLTMQLFQAGDQAVFEFDRFELRAP
jgi:hypothetical protein